MSDEYVPAITMSAPAPAPAGGGDQATPPAAPASPDPRAAFAQPAEAAATDDPDRAPPDTSRGQREVSDRVRGMLRTIAKTAQVDEGVADDLVPMDADGEQSAPARSPAPAPPAPQPAAPPGPAALPPALPQLRLPESVAAPNPPAPGSAADEQRKALLDQRERELEERARHIEEKAKTLPTMERLAEAPAATITALLQQTFGITDPEELKTLVADVMTEAAELHMGAKPPPEVKGQLDGRRAVRSVKALRAMQEAERKQLEAQRIEAEKTARAEREKAEAAALERQYVEHINTQLSPHASAFPFLTNQRVTGGVPAGAIVYEVYKEQERLFKAGASPQKPDLGLAAKFADDYYRTQAEAAAKDAAYFQSLFSPAQPAQPPAPAAPQASQQPSPGGASGPAPTTQRQPATPANAPAESEPDASELTFHPDRQERRRQSLAKLKARYAGGAA